MLDTSPDALAARYRKMIGPRAVVQVQS
ncbi:protein of unknown function [Methylorubrum extorquens]|uniref:Uncharacterized protein n=1 Tax=Methylorubrum extorquens TaxID=408 RepID=A0A2N9AYI0_METEX|nr:protein of unknown function [Methylorubrum extorquens]